MKAAEFVERIVSDPRRAAMRYLQEQGSAPYFRCVQSPVDAVTVVDGHPRIMLGSNNYLGLANHPAVVEQARRAVERFGGAMLGSRLFTGTTDAHLELERELAAWHGTEDVVVFSTGYQTSVGAICAVAGPGDTVVVDSAVHASIRDGCRMSDAAVRTFQHNDPDSLRAQLARVAERRGVVLVVVEGLYSMEGDLASLETISGVCVDHGVALMVDEAHSLALFGDHGTGVVELCGVQDRVEMRMGTFSKALASMGGFVAGSRDLVDMLRVNARSFIFSMSAVPAAVAAALAAVRIARSDEGRELADTALANGIYLRNMLRDWDIRALGDTAPASAECHGGPIVAVEVGDEIAAVGIWRQIFDSGVFAGLSMFPAVAVGRALLRLSVMATHTHTQLEQAAEAVATAIRPVSGVADRSGNRTGIV